MDSLEARRDQFREQDEKEMEAWRQRREEWTREFDPGDLVMLMQEENKKRLMPK